MHRKLKYRFVGRVNGLYIWESTTTIAPNESRYEQVRCAVPWFWASAPPKAGA